MTDINFDNITVKENEPLSKHSSFKIGGNAKYALYPQSSDELTRAIKICIKEGLRYKVIGNATNVLFDDNGFDGAIIFTSHINSTQYIHQNGGITSVRVGCGRSLTELAYDIGKKYCLSGLEFAYGIPGTVGGAIYMNAGAYGSQMSDVVIETECYDADKNIIKNISKKEQMFGYRRSIFSAEPALTVISSTLELKNGNGKIILEKMSKNMSSRKEKQPLEYPNAGSIFKRPGDNIFSGKLIEDAHLKGYTVGGAQISEKHAGFIINRGGATSNDVLTLIDHIKNTVSAQFDIDLECEVIFIPYN